MMTFPFCVLDRFLLWFRAIVMLTFLLRALCFLVSPLLPVPLFALALPHRPRLVALADAFLGG
jgi:hypothetical protein